MGNNSYLFHVGRFQRHLPWPPGPLPKELQILRSLQRVWIRVGGSLLCSPLLVRRLPPSHGVLSGLLVVEPRVLRLDGGEAVLDGVREYVGEELALLRLPALVLEGQN